MARVKKAEYTAGHGAPADRLSFGRAMRAFEVHDEEGRKLRREFEKLFPAELKTALCFRIWEKWEALSISDFGNPLIPEISVIPNIGDLRLISLNKVHSGRSPTRLPDRAQPTSETAPTQPQKTVDLDWLRTKADRLIRVPLIEKFDRVVPDDEMIALVEYAKSLWPVDDRSKPELYSSLWKLGRTICERLPYSPESLEKLFTSYGASSYYKMVDGNASPRHFIAFVYEQIAWMALQRGWVLCLAEDGHISGESLLTSVRPESFPPLSADSKIALPSNLGLQRQGDLDMRIRNLIAADRLWFVLVDELRMSQAPVRILSGPRSGRDVGKEDVAQKIIIQLHHDKLGARMVRADVLNALKKAGFTKNAADRIWDKSAPEVWRISGRPPSGVKRISTDDLLAALRRGGV